MAFSWRKYYNIPALTISVFLLASPCLAAEFSDVFFSGHISVIDLLIDLILFSIFIFLAARIVIHERRERKKAVSELNNFLERTSSYSKQIDQFTLAAASMLSIEEESILFKKIADTIVEYSDYSRVMISLFKDGEPQREILGYAGLSSELVAIMSSIPVSKPYFEAVSELADPVGQFSFYVPHTKKHILNQDVVQYGEGPIPLDNNKWHPQDNLLVNMRDEHGKLIGVISMDSSKSGLKPVDETVRPIEIFSSLIAQLVLIKRGEQRQQDLQYQLDQYSRSETFSRMTERITADLNDSISDILTSTDISLLNTQANLPLHDSLKRIRQVAYLASQHVQRLASFSPKGAQQAAGFNIVPAIEESITLVRANLPASLELQLNIQANEALVRTGATQITQVIHNLCANSIEAMHLHGGTLSISLNLIKIKPESVGVPGDMEYGPYARIIVSDTGPGIDPAIIHQIFDPGFSTKTDNNSKGMGLPQAKNLIEGCHGRITVSSTPDFGAIFTIYLPLYQEPAAALEQHEEHIISGSKHVLFVDDDQSILSLASAIFEQLGYTVETISSPLEALDIFREYPEKFDLIVIDMTMPEMTGDKLASHILTIRPEIPIILATGYSDRISREEAFHIGIKGYYEKPLTIQPFSKIVREVLSMH